MQRLSWTIEEIKKVGQDDSLLSACEQRIADLERENAELKASMNNASAMTPEYEAAYEKHGGCTQSQHIQTILDLERELQEARDLHQQSERSNVLMRLQCDGYKEQVKAEREKRELAEAFLFQWMAAWPEDDATKDYFANRDKAGCV
jgi:hypothetical protein